MDSFYAQFSTCDRYLYKFISDPINFYSNFEEMLSFYGELIALQKMWNSFNEKDLFVSKYHVSKETIENQISSSENIRNQLINLRITK